MDFAQFTPVASLAGGALIGLAAVMMMGLEGRIAGISGIANRLFPPFTDAGWLRRAAFLAGIVAAPVVWAALSGRMVVPTLAWSPPVMIVAGGLVGFGAVMGNGCTSGHGVCGLSRLSVRSLVATLVFMAAAMVTVFVTRHLL